MTVQTLNFIVVEFLVVNVMSLLPHRKKSKFSIGKG